jgi:phage replication-related protein YjqB (UPF0714/DUF867 family)
MKGKRIMSNDNMMLPAVDRRGFFKALGATTLPLLGQGCEGGEGDALIFRSGAKQGPTNVDIEVWRALLEQNLIGREQRCSIPAKHSNTIDIGDQVRLIRSSTEYALYTVDERRANDNPDVVRMGLDARLRLGTSEPFTATLSTEIVARDLDDAQAEAQGELVERLVDDGKNTGLIVIAPHGGMIEAHTDDQAEWVRQSLPGSSSWICKGWCPGGGAYERWHITSTALSPNSFAGLGAVTDRGFAYAVSFHGMSSGGVLIGGGAPIELKQAVRDAIVTELGDSTVAVTIASATDMYDGDSPENVVNWLSAGGSGGLQIEQSHEARVLRWQAIAQAVVGVYGQLL